MTHLTDNPLENFSDNQTKSIINPTGITSPPPFYTKRPNGLQITRLKLFPKRKQLHQPKTLYRTSTLHSSSVQHPILPSYSNVNPTPNDVIVENIPVTDDTDSPTKIHSETNDPFAPLSFKTEITLRPFLL